MVIYIETKPVWSVTHLFHTSPCRKENYLSISFSVCHKNKQFLAEATDIMYFLHKQKALLVKK